MSFKLVLCVAKILVAIFISGGMVSLECCFFGLRLFVLANTSCTCLEYLDQISKIPKNSFPASAASVRLRALTVVGGHQYTTITVSDVMDFGPHLSCGCVAILF